MKEKGKEWVETASGGYWRKITGVSHSHKLDFFCPHCKRPTGTIDDKYLETIGICSVCNVNFVEDRHVPSIDLSRYKK
jgi:hypothetical protein